jgi:predicted metalloprotease
MKWEQGRRSSNVEDRRGRRRSAGIAIGGGGGVILVAAIMLLMGKDPMAVLQSVLGNSADNGQYVEEPSSPEEDRLADMCSVVLADTEDTWSAIFRKTGKTYAEPTLVIFTDSTESGCGTAAQALAPSTVRRTSGSTST